MIKGTRAQPGDIKRYPSIDRSKLKKVEVRPNAEVMKGTRQTNKDTGGKK
jgi:hypothetical protein